MKEDKEFYRHIYNAELCSCFPELSGVTLLVRQANFILKFGRNLEVSYPKNLYCIIKDRTVIKLLTNEEFKANKRTEQEWEKLINEIQ